MAGRQSFLRTTLKTRRAFARLRDPQFWRLASGLVLFSFAITHFLNHALGHISVDVMEAAQEWRRGFWRSWPGTILLYGALATHVSLVLAKLAARRTWRVPAWEGAQIALGLTIPFLGAAHVMATRGVSAATGFDDTYTAELRLLWPGLAWSQSLLLAVVWLHAMLGLNHWLKVQRWYSTWSPILLVGAVLVPTLAVTGWIEAARRLSLKTFSEPPMTPAMLEAGDGLIQAAQASVWTGFWLLVAVIVGWRSIEWFRPGARVTYADGRTARALPGATLLEISRAAGVPHASVCGGRGRCTTCRVMVLGGGDTLPPPNTVEANALDRISAPPGVRLACQVRPTADVRIRPLVPLQDAEPSIASDSHRWGVERRITVMFADLRDFTALAERLYPYDSVFLLNRFFAVMSEAVERHGGEVDKFLGDGIMALFGITAAQGAGSRDALRAARDMMGALDELNREFGGTLADPLRMGIGIHTGPAVLGRVGGSRRGSLTALGDSVNIASRLEGLNKQFGSVLVVSEDALIHSGLVFGEAEMREVPLRGRGVGLRVAVVHDVSTLRDRLPAEA